MIKLNVIYYADSDTSKALTADFFIDPTSISGVHGHPNGSVVLPYNKVVKETCKEVMALISETGAEAVRDLQEKRHEEGIKMSQAIFGKLTEGDI